MPAPQIASQRHLPKERSQTMFRDAAFVQVGEQSERELFPKSEPHYFVSSDFSIAGEFPAASETPFPSIVFIRRFSGSGVRTPYITRIVGATSSDGFSASLLFSAFFTLEQAVENPSSAIIANFSFLPIVCVVFGTSQATNIL